MRNKLRNIVRRAQQSFEMTTRPKVAKAFKRAVAEGLFDVEWYQEHYGTFPHALAAFKDFSEKSKSSNVNPSPNFDTEYYLRCNQDIYLAGIEPLTHFMYHGRHEHRASSKVMNRWFPSTDLVAKETSSWKQQKVAIVLHIFYPDFVDKFAASVQRFPTNVDVFITAGTDAIKNKALKTFNGLKNVQKVQAVLCENRGRNFGPFLVNFSDELLDYDLMCHLHSKKSLYSGREQTQWFDYQNNFLLKDKHVVKSILRLFDEREELGIYYPTSFWMMPAWVNHWTCNKGISQDFVDKWGLDISDDFVNYPVGGMFWARPKAIAPLLKEKFEYSDFPEEPLPNDGSWLHALERSIGLLAEKQGFKQFFYYPPQGKFTTDKSYISSSYYKPFETVLSDLNTFDIISFDIFDTVLRREYTEPDYAKFKLGRELVKLSYFSSEKDFVAQRNNAELACRKMRAFEGDVDIYETYEKLAEALSIPKVTTKEWADKEFYFDLSMAKPKDEMVKILHNLHEKGKEIWFVTDIYYTKAQITKMLRKIGITISFKLFVSSDLRKRKDAGTMWTYVKGLVDESGKTFIHVGDNVRSDAQICGDFGLNNLHILNPIDKWRIANFPMPDFENEQNILKWGKQVSHFGRYPFFGE